MINKQKTIIFDLCNVLFQFNPDHKRSEERYTPLTQGIDLLKQCHAATYANGERRNTLFILSNVSTASFEILRKNYPKIIDLFDGAVISGEVHWRKPNTHIYQHLLQKYKLAPQECIFIDDKNVNVLVAQSIGMHGIVFDNATNVAGQLKTLQVF